MNVKDTVRNSLLCFSGIHRNILDVYDHLFCVIGNGFEWKGGELVESDEDKPISLLDAVRHVVEFELLESAAISSSASFDYDKENPDPEGMLRKYSRKRYESIMEELDMMERIDERMDDFTVPTSEKYAGMKPIEETACHLGEPVWQFYPLCEYSKMCCIPEDVKPDWLAALRQLYDFMEAHHELLHYTGYNDQVEILHKAGKRIAELEAKLLK